MGVTEYEPKVVHQLLEFTYRYISDTLEDAKVYANHAGRNNISLEDTKLSILTQMEHSFTSPPPREFLVDIARQKNVVALPPLKNYSAARLPPDRYCLLSVNYRLQASGDKKIMRKGQLINTKYTVNQSSTPQKHLFVNPQVIMPSSTTKRKWNDTDDYDN
uniref:Transcription initiation factor TFIID subunit 9 n=1 Tax=Ciona savignyi TaxID=51511 RepID=H2Y5F9_CIOSA